MKAADVSIKPTTSMRRLPSLRLPTLVVLATMAVVEACAGDASEGAPRSHSLPCVADLDCPTNFPLCVKNTCRPSTDGGAATDPKAVCAGVDTDRDPSNCGACGHVCGPVKLALGANLSAFAIDATNIYWTNADSTGTPCVAPCDGTVMKMPLHGGSPMTLASGQPSPIAPFIVGATSVVWTNYGDVSGMRSIVTVPLGGGSPVALATGDASQIPSAIAIDATNFYWASVPDGAIMKRALAGGAAVTLVSGPGTSGPIAVDATSVYWVSQDIGEPLMKVPIAGGSPVVLAATLAYYPGNIAVDATSVYWAAGGYLMKVPLGGGCPVTVATGGGGTVVVDALNAYWTGADPGQSGTLMKAPLAGGTPVVLADQVDASPIAVNATSVYWMTTETRTNVRSVWEMPLDGGVTCEGGVCIAPPFTGDPAAPPRPPGPGESAIADACLGAGGSGGAGAAGGE